MKATEIKSALRRNRRRGRRPWSLYQIAQMRGCSRSLVTMVVKGQKSSAPLTAFIHSLLRDNGTGAA